MASRAAVTRRPAERSRTASAAVMAVTLPRETRSIRGGLAAAVRAGADRLPPGPRPGEARPGRAEPGQDERDETVPRIIIWVPQMHDRMPPIRDDAPGCPERHRVGPAARYGADVRRARARRPAGCGLQTAARTCSRHAAR